MTFISSDVRKEYVRGRLLEADAPADPLALFDEWLRGAIEAGVREPNAMTLATVGSAGRPSARVVLLKGVDARGFQFFTNYASRKGADLEVNPRAALCFWWGDLERQIRIEGETQRLPPAESDAYYLSRPLGSRLGSLASEQSRIVSGRAELEARLAELEAEYSESNPPPRPAWWGGYLLNPDAMEFWQGGPNRLHDRLLYSRDAGAVWSLQRLAP